MVYTVFIEWRRHLLQNKERLVGEVRRACFQISKAATIITFDSRKRSKGGGGGGGGGGAADPAKDAKIDA